MNQPVNYSEGQAKTLQATTLEDSVANVDLDFRDDKDSVTFAKIDNPATRGKAQADTLSKLLVYPNPDPSRLLHIQLRNCDQSTTINIYLFDMYGKRLGLTTAHTDPYCACDTSIILPGNGSHMYILKTVSRTETKEAKILVL